MTKGIKNEIAIIGMDMCRASVMLDPRVYKTSVDTHPVYLFSGILAERAPTIFFISMGSPFG